MIIPEFLKRENVQLKKTDFEIALEKYEKHFGVELCTEPYMLTESEWVEVIKHSLDTNTPILDEIIDDEDY